MISYTFQSTLPRRERLDGDYDIGAVADFNPRSHEGSDIIWAKDSLVLSRFQSTLPRRERLIFSVSSPPRKYFNPRSHEGSDLATRRPVRTSNYFNPRSHEGSDTTDYPINFTKAISIHAPTKGATAVASNTSKSVEFQSTLPRRERQHFAQLPSLVVNFNPRSHEGSDKANFSYYDTETISIHAPTKGATRGCLHPTCGHYFNPRSHEGSDLVVSSTDRVVDDFNPRSHEGSDAAIYMPVFMISIFQSTLPRRERPEYWQATPRSFLISIHAPTKGATLCLRHLCQIEPEFQSTLPRRERPPE